ncbi:DNA/RNA non-specific endonuclease [Nostoc sp.]|uniref:DNA/RNA non-specific endonuclease n=1 Tax=Nostoc sp. TaxID=1180 RepID=UPI002FF9E562
MLFLHFLEDPKLPFNEKVQHDDFATDSTGYTRGHMGTGEHRNRNQQDYLATFLTSNIIPQPENINKRWGGLETFLTNLVKDENKEIYIVAGGDGQAVDKYGVPITPLSNKIIVTKNVWKVVLVLDKPGQGISDVTNDTLAFALALYLPNVNKNQAQIKPKLAL